MGVKLLIQQAQAHKRLFLAQAETLLEGGGIRRDGCGRQKLFQQLAYGTAMLLNKLGMHVDRQLADIEAGTRMMQEIGADGEEIVPQTVQRSDLLRRVQQPRFQLRQMRADQCDILPEMLKLLLFCQQSQEILFRLDEDARGKRLRSQAARLLHLILNGITVTAPFTGLRL